MIDTINKDKEVAILDFMTDLGFEIYEPNYLLDYFVEEHFVLDTDEVLDYIREFTGVKEIPIEWLNIEEVINSQKNLILLYEGLYINTDKIRANKDFLIKKGYIGELNKEVTMEDMYGEILELKRELEKHKNELNKLKVKINEITGKTRLRPKKVKPDNKAQYIVKRRG